LANESYATAFKIFDFGNATAVSSVPGQNVAPPSPRAPINYNLTNIVGAERYE